MAADRRSPGSEERAYKPRGDVALGGKLLVYGQGAASRYENGRPPSV